MKLRIILYLATVLPLAAQIDQGSLNGTVKDASGAAIAGATVEARSASTGVRRQSVTGPAGAYQIPMLPVGAYTVTIAKPGFRTSEYKDIEIAIGQRTIDVQLAVGAVTESVEVTAVAEAVNRTSAEVGGLIEAEQIKEIPVSGRNWASLMLLAPGAVNYSDGSQRNIRFNGHSIDDANYTFDGIDNNGVQEQTQKAESRLNISLDSIAEFRVSTAAYTAESGAAGGVQVQVVSKTGSNQFHGGTLYALRNDALDARSPFDGPTLPPFTLHQFGANLGGPIKKDKAFFFANYEGLRQDLGVTFVSFVPNATYRSQVLAKSPSLAPLVNAWPAGQARLDSTTDQINLVATNHVREDSGMFRFDYRFDDRNTLYARYNTDNVYIDNPTDALGSHNVVPHAPTNAVLAFQRIISPSIVNEAKFGVNRANYHNWSYGIAPLSVSVSSASFSGLTGTSLDTEVGTTFSYIDNLTVVRGKHTLKFGANIMRVRLNNSGNTLTTSSISYASTDDFINNKASSATYLQGEGVVGNRRTFYQGYAQDEFKVSPSLTLNLGLRYEFYSVVHEILNRSAVVDIAGCGGFCPKGTAYYEPNYHDFGPRIGAAWAPAIFHGKTTFRSGFGIYYGGNQNDDFSDPAESAVPRYSLSSSDFPALAYPLTAFLDPRNQLFSPKAIDRHRKDLYYENWDFVVQHEIAHDFVGQISYIGGEGHHLFDRYTINLINPVTGTRPLAGFGSFGLKRNDGNNNFHALQVSLQRRFVRGLLFQTQYAWAHGITDASIGSGESVALQNMACRACDRSSSNIDVRHVITMNGVYQLPFARQNRLLGGWEIAGIASARTGLPVNVTVSRTAAALPDGNTSNQRPNLVPGVPIYATDRNINNWFNAGAFSAPANGTWGNLGRYIANGPGAFEIDSSLQKRFRVTERVRLIFRAAAFNLLNHPEFKTPGASVGSVSGSGSNLTIKQSASFGRITGVLNTGATGTGAPRRIEFLFRAEF
ncbi:MAG TPA: TonB-dependent receptor [Candidatus Solibacter sp.]|nr:TonB-dependent receptor [Candidatus Solibacter sp.]